MRVGSSRLARCARFFAALGILASAVLLLFLPAGAQTGGDTGSFAEFNNEGWWQKQAFPPNVPANGLPVSADGGETSRVTAFGMDVHVGADELLTGLTLVLKESTAPGANYPPPAPAQPPATPVPLPGQVPTPPRADILVVACPVVEIYTPEDGGADANKPVADCDAARGDGVRAADGTWEFDLTSLAQLWESNFIENKGVLLIERVNAPVTFQVVFQDLSTNTPQLVLSTDLVPVEEEEEEEEFEEEFTEVIPGDDGNVFTDIVDSGSGTTTTPVGIVETPPTTAAPAEPAPEPEPVVNRKPTKGTLPLAMLLLLPVLVGLALVGGMVLGPDGDPATARTREGGLSRALARREASFASE